MKMCWYNEVHKWVNDDTIFKRMKAINDFERLLSGITIRRY